MKKRAAWIGAAALAAAMLVGCAPAGTAGTGGRLPGGISHNVVNGEVRSVDTRSNRIVVRQDGGRNVAVRFDRQTTVVYRQRRYPVTALERGDRVTMRVSRERGGQVIADRIDVRQSVRDRGGVAGRVQRVEGTVGRVDARRGSFSVVVDRRTTIVVHAPVDLRRADAVRIQRLRRGEHVRADVRAVGRNQFELVRFR